MNAGRIITEYLCYLMNRLDLTAEGADGFLRMCETLQEIAYSPVNAMDANRCDDCLELRKDYVVHDYPNDISIQDMILDELDDEYGMYGTMLEIMVILAEKMNYETLDSEYEASPRKWFREMLVNCGLDRNWRNEDFDTEGNEETILDAMNRVIFRKIGWDGEGGFFPLAYPQGDQRKVEIIIQMNNYLEENYDI